MYVCFFLFVIANTLHICERIPLLRTRYYKSSTKNSQGLVWLNKYVYNMFADCEFSEYFDIKIRTGLEGNLFI